MTLLTQAAEALHALREGREPSDAQADRIKNLEAEVARLRGQLAARFTGITPQGGCKIIELRPMPGGARPIVEVEYTPGSPATDVDPGEPAQCWINGCLIATAHGERLVHVLDLIEWLQDHDAALTALEAGQ